MQPICLYKTGVFWHQDTNKSVFLFMHLVDTDVIYSCGTSYSVVTNSRIERSECWVHCHM